MAKGKKKINNSLAKTDEIQLNKIGVFFRRPTLNNILRMLTMHSGQYRTFKAVKNINKLFANLDMRKYRSNPELESYIWSISFFSKQWLDGILTPDTIAMLAQSQPGYDDLKGDIINASINSKEIISAPEAKALLDIIGESLQFGYIITLRDEYISLLEDISMDEPGAFKQLVTRLFLISQSLLDIKHSTNLISNKITFSTSDIDSVRSSLGMTIDSLKDGSNIYKTGIKRLNTLLSPGFMNGRLYTFLGVAGSGKSILLLKIALDMRKYNPNIKAKTPGMRPCVLYITMENTFTESIERVWNMCFDDPITRFSEDEAVEMLCRELGVKRVLKEDVIAYDNDSGERLSAQLEENDAKRNNTDSNIEIVMKYFSYREISTDDLFTIIHDLRDENLEVCALVFDYIKRIEPANPVPDNTRMELDMIANELKALASIQDIPVITAHQFNRAAASAIDNAARQGKGDLIKLAGRENIGDSWPVYETSDFVAALNIEYKPGTDDRYLCVNVLKRRRVDAEAGEMAKYTYLAHPFAKNNGLRLIDDYNLDKVLSLKSLASDIDIIPSEKANAVPRKNSSKKEFGNDDDHI